MHQREAIREQGKRLHAPSELLRIERIDRQIDVHALDFIVVFVI